MKDAPQVKAGDRVRVVLEGTASAVEWKSGSFDIGGCNYIIPSKEHVVSVDVEVLAKPFKVGDTVSGDDYAKLPVGTHVIFGDRIRVKVARDRWVLLDGCDSAPSTSTSNVALQMARVIKYLPDAS